MQKKKNFTQVGNGFLQTSLISKNAKLVFMLLTMYSNDGKLNRQGSDCFPSQKRLSYSLNLGERQVSRALCELEKLDLIRRVNRKDTKGRRSNVNHYLVNWKFYGEFFLVERNRGAIEKFDAHLAGAMATRQASQPDTGDRLATRHICPVDSLGNQTQVSNEKDEFIEKEEYVFNGSAKLSKINSTPENSERIPKEQKPLEMPVKGISSASDILAGFRELSDDGVLPASLEMAAESMHKGKHEHVGKDALGKEERKKWSSHFDDEFLDILGDLKNMYKMNLSEISDTEILAFRGKMETLLDAELFPDVVGKIAEWSVNREESFRHLINNGAVKEAAAIYADVELGRFKEIVALKAGTTGLKMTGKSDRSS